MASGPSPRLCGRPLDVLVALRLQILVIALLAFAVLGQESIEDAFRAAMTDGLSSLRGTLLSLLGVGALIVLQIVLWSTGTVQIRALVPFGAGVNEQTVYGILARALPSAIAALPPVIVFVTLFIIYSDGGFLEAREAANAFAVTSEQLTNNKDQVAPDPTADMASTFTQTQTPLAVLAVILVLLIFAFAIPAASGVRRAWFFKDRDPQAHDLQDEPAVPSFLLWLWFLVGQGWALACAIGTAIAFILLQLLPPTGFTRFLIFAFVFATWAFLLRAFYGVPAVGILRAHRVLRTAQRGNASGRVSRWTFWVALLLVAAVCVSAFFTLRWSSVVGVPVVLFLSLAALLAILAPLAYYGDAMRLPLIASAFAWNVAIALSGLATNHTVRGVGDGTVVATNRQVLVLNHCLNRRADWPDLSACLKSPREVLNLKAWLKNWPDLGYYRNYPIILIATQGGGMRAAYHTAYALATLADLCPAFPYHVLAISSVSGGSFGSLIYTSTIAAQPAPAPGAEPCGDGSSTNVRHAVAKALDKDYLSPLLAGFLITDIVQQFLPFPVGAFDRARHLEDALRDSLQVGQDEGRALTASAHSGQSKEGAGSNVPDPTGTLRDFAFRSGGWVPPAAGQAFGRYAVPALIFNATDMKHGNDRPFLNFCLQEPDRMDCSPPAMPGALGYAAMDLATNPRLGDVSPVVAASASARFPTLTPTAGLETFDDGRHNLGNGGYRTLGDGGYFENSGADALTGFLVRFNAVREKLLASGARDPDEQTLVDATIVVITFDVDDCVDIRDNDRVQDCINLSEDPKLQKIGDVAEIIAPVTGLMATRSARAELAVRRLHQMIESERKSFCENFPIDHQRCMNYAFLDEFVFELRRNPVDVKQRVSIPLSWLLSEGAKGSIQDQHAIPSAERRNGARPFPDWRTNTEKAIVGIACILSWKGRSGEDVPLCVDRTPKPAAN